MIQTQPSEFYNHSLSIQNRRVIIATFIMKHLDCSRNRMTNIHNTQTYKHEDESPIISAYYLIMSKCLPKVFNANLLQCQFNILQCGGQWSKRQVIPNKAHHMPTQY